MILAAALYQLIAAHAEYDGQDLILTKDVEITHPLGTLYAQRAHLRQVKINEDTPFTRIELQDQIHIHSDNAGRSFDLTSDSANGEISAESLYTFQSLNFEGNVECKGRDSFCATAPRAHYQAMPGQQGTLKLFPTCRLTFASATLDSEGPLNLRLQENLAETEHPLKYQDTFIRIEAQNGRLTYLNEANHIEPQAIYCDGNVRIYSEENYALADQLVYFPKTQTLHLFAQAPGHVLFWKSDGTIQISAPEVQAHFDHKQQKEEIQGIGDVHFTFDLDEENRIETLFGKYL
jgi:hypothetical protein